MIKCIIIDDEPLAQSILEKYIQLTKQLQLIKKCNNAGEAYSTLVDQQIDLIFLDIKMPLISGIDFIKSLKNPPAVIFTTAFSEYAVTSYELQDIDYLLKPVTYDRFLKSIDKFLKVNNDPAVAEKEYLYVKVTGRLVKIYYSDIFYAESLKDYIKIKTEKENHITHMTMKTLAGLLPPTFFVRIHRSFIINKQHITTIGKNIVEVKGVEIPIGESYKKIVTDLLKLQ